MRRPRRWAPTIPPTPPHRQTILLGSRRYIVRSVGRSSASRRAEGSPLRLRQKEIDRQAPLRPWTSAPRPPASPLRNLSAADRHMWPRSMWNREICDEAGQDDNVISARLSSEQLCCSDCQYAVCRPAAFPFRPSSSVSLLPASRPYSTWPLLRATHQRKLHSVPPPLVSPVPTSSLHAWSVPAESIGPLR